MSAQKAKLGQAVAWYKGGLNSTVPELAFVVGLGVGSLVDLKILAKGTERCPCITGCRHADDKGAKDEERRLNGSWEAIEDYHVREELRQMEAAEKARPENLSTMRHRHAPVVPQAQLAEA